MRKAIALSAAALLVIAGVAGAQTYSAIITGPQDGTSSPGTGTGSFTLDASKILSFNITYSGLTATETAAHIHCCAPPGQAGGVLFGLPATSGTKVGTVGPLTPTQEGNLNAGLMYVNIHTTANPGGEIRGQIFNTVSVEASTWGRVKALYQ